MPAQLNSALRRGGTAHSPMLRRKDESSCRRSDTHWAKGPAKFDGPDVICEYLFRYNTLGRVTDIWFDF
jgi:hypothetical protein